MTKPEEVRIIRCSSCGGDGGHHDFAGQWSRCYLCDGDGAELHVVYGYWNDEGWWPVNNWMVLTHDV